MIKRLFNSRTDGIHCLLNLNSARIVTTKHWSKNVEAISLIAVPEYSPRKAIHTAVCVNWLKPVA